MTGRSPDAPKPPRGGRGRFVRSPDTAIRDGEAARLRAQGLTLQQIADRLGFASPGGVHDAIKRALAAAPAAGAEELRARSLARLNLQYETAQEIAEREHLVVSHGRVVTTDDGEPLRDSGPELAALDRMIRIDAEVRKLFGLDAPTRVSVDAENLGREIIELLTALGGGGDDGG